MSLTTLTAAPTNDDFTPLSEHRESTPGSFFGGNPVLHLQAPASKLQISKEDLEAQQAIKALAANTDDAAVDKDGLIEIQDIDVWVTSSHLTLWSPTTNKGAQITYPTITVHAQVGAAVLLELNLSDSNMVPDEDIEHLQIRLTPSQILSSAPAGTSQTNGSAAARQAGPSFALYMAIGDCQELNPDPAEDESDEEGYGEQPAFDETAPGATGWITSENIHEYTDEDGNFKMPEGVTVIGGEDDEGDGAVLGEGAGRVRRADEVDADEAADAEAKWQKTG
ncbi:hypothetical protein Q7P37_000860 [Cladosporium fusiforme]